MKIKLYLYEGSSVSDYTNLNKLLNQGLDEAYIEILTLPVNLGDEIGKDKPLGADLGTYISMVLSSSATAAIVAGIFDLVKRHKEEKKRMSEQQLINEKVDFQLEKPDGTRVSFSFCTFSEEERHVFFELIKMHLES